MCASTPVTSQAHKVAALRVCSRRLPVSPFFGDCVGGLPRRGHCRCWQPWHCSGLRGGRGHCSRRERGLPHVVEVQTPQHCFGLACSCPRQSSPLAGGCLCRSPPAVGACSRASSASPCRSAWSRRGRCSSFSLLVLRLGLSAVVHGDCPPKLGLLPVVQRVVQVHG